MGFTLHRNYISNLLSKPLELQTEGGVARVQHTSLPRCKRYSEPAWCPWGQLDHSQSKCQSHRNFYSTLEKNVLVLTNWVLSEFQSDFMGWNRIGLSMVKLRTWTLIIGTLDSWQNTIASEYLMKVSMFMRAKKTLFPMFSLKCTSLKGSPYLSHLSLLMAFTSLHRTIPSCMHWKDSS